MKTHDFPNVKSVLFITIVFGGLLLQLTSCATLTGTITGGSIDNRQPKKEMRMEGREVARLRRNANITVYRKGADPRSGFYYATAKHAPQKDSVDNLLVVGTKKIKQNHIIADFTGVPPKIAIDTIPFESIEYVYVPARKHKGIFLGFTIGLGIDAGIILLTLSSLSF